MSDQEEKEIAYYLLCSAVERKTFLELDGFDLRKELQYNKLCDLIEKYNLNVFDLADKLVKNGLIKRIQYQSSGGFTKTLLFSIKSEAKFT